MSQRETYRKLSNLFRRGLGENLLPRRVFETAINLITEAGFPTAAFRYMTPLRRIVTNDDMVETGTLGAYFATRLERTPTDKNIDWKALGWDGEPHMMLFPHFPAVWVILHEFGHYFDDTFIRSIDQFNLPQSRLDQFNELYEQMKEEFIKTQERGREEVIRYHGLEAAMSKTWWWKIPEAHAFREAPTAYSYATFAEWFAECFQTQCIWKLSNSLPEKNPKTSAFMGFLLSGKIFRKSSRKISYVPVTGLEFRQAASQV